MSISSRTATELIDTMRYLAKHRSVHLEWTRRDQRLSPRAYDILLLIERACNEGREIYAPEIARALDLTPARISQLIKCLIAEQRITRGEKTFKGRPLSIYFTPEDLDRTPQ